MRIKSVTCTDEGGRSNDFLVCIEHISVAGNALRRARPQNEKIFYRSASHDRCMTKKDVRVDRQEEILYFDLFPVGLITNRKEKIRVITFFHQIKKVID